MLSCSSRLFFQGPVSEVLGTGRAGPSKQDGAAAAAMEAPVAAAVASVAAAHAAVERTVVVFVSLPCLPL